MRFLFKRVWVILPMLMFMGCPWGGGAYGYKYNTGTFPSNPVNFTEINTEYDDYNMSAPTLGETFPLVFSSTRNSKGDNFDLVYKLITISFSKTTGELEIGEEKGGYDVSTRNSTLVQAVKKVNTPQDELGPFLIREDQGILIEHTWYNRFYLLYSTEENGKHNIHFTHNSLSGEYEDSKDVSFLNSEANDAYPCVSPDRSSLYFCSDREGNFDIYIAETDPKKEILEILESEEDVPIRKDSLLSSDGDDKCPYIAYSGWAQSWDEIVKNMLVFASNREGGYGGFDLYYSMFEDGQWGAPINFGPGINTEYDEYRPIVRPQYDFTNDFMLFSSNRPGGLGGFDLYYVGIPDIGYSWE